MLEATQGPSGAQEVAQTLLGEAQEVAPGASPEEGVPPSGEVRLRAPQEVEKGAEEGAEG